jgi:hypothetical protein
MTVVRRAPSQRQGQKIDRADRETDLARQASIQPARDGKQAVNELTFKADRSLGVDQANRRMKLELHDGHGPRLGHVQIR